MHEDLGLHMRKRLAPLPVLADRDRDVPTEGYAWRAYFAEALGEWSILVATPRGLGVYMQNINVDIYTGALLVVEDLSELLIDRWTATVFSECSAGDNLDDTRDCLRRYFQWSHEYFLDDIRRSNELARDRTSRHPRTSVFRIVCDDGADLRQRWLANDAARVRLEISVGEEKHWYSTTVATLDGLHSRLHDGVIARPLVVTSEWDAKRIWDFLVATVRACDVGSHSDVRDLLRLRFDECAPLE